MRQRCALVRSALVIGLLLAVLPLSCEPAEEATIQAKATLCGAPWQGRAHYKLSTPGGLSAIDCTEVPSSHDVEPGSWTCTYVSGGPPGAYLVNITPSATQNASQGDTITFTLNFEPIRNAAVEFLTWTIDGNPIGEASQPVEHVVFPCQTVGVRFKQWVDGCEGHKAALNETSWLQIAQIEGPAGVKIWTFSEDCAVTKVPPPQGLPPVKKSQVPSVNGKPVRQGTMIELPPPLLPVMTTLDLDTVWELAKSLNYTKAVKWLGISRYPFEPPGHECALFELVVPGPGYYKFALAASVEVSLADGDDMSPQNNRAESSPLVLAVWVPTPPEPWPGA